MSRCFDASRLQQGESRTFRISKHVCIRSLALERDLGREMPEKVQPMRTFAEGAIMENPEVRPKMKHGPTMHHRARQTAIARVAALKKFERLGGDPRFGFDLGQTFPTERACGNGLTLSVDEQSVVRNCAAKCFSVMPAWNVRERARINQPFPPVYGEVNGQRIRVTKPRRKRALRASVNGKLLANFVALCHHINSTVRKRRCLHASIDASQFLVL